MLDFINQNTFQEFAHYVVNPHWDPNILRKNAIIYVQTDHLQNVFNNIKFSKNKYIIISSGSDWPIDATRFSLRPLNVVKWYAINATYSHPDLIPIPYGIYQHVNAHELQPKIDWFIQDENIEKLKNNEKNIDVLYASWNYISNRKDRVGVLSKIRANGVKVLWDRPGKEESDGSNTPYNEYLEHLSHYKFQICPPGNGLDSYRIWDHCYMGGIPIVLKNNNWKNFPVIQVNDWSEVTYDLLHSYLDKEMNNERIYMTYWKNRITKEFNNL